MIKDTEVHNGLEGKEMRNFYQETLVQYELKEIAVGVKRKESKQLAYDTWNTKRSENLSSLRLHVRLAEIEAEYANENLRISECRLGLFLTLDGLGWSTHDMSEYVGKNGERYRPFIGTEEEFDKFIEQLAK